MRGSPREARGRGAVRSGGARERARPQRALRRPYGARAPFAGDRRACSVRPLDHPGLPAEALRYPFLPRACAARSGARPRRARNSRFTLDCAARGARAERRRFKLLFPTERNLWKLARHADAASALAAARATPVVTVLPERIEVDGGPGLRIPPEAGYGGEAFSVRGLALRSSCCQRSSCLVLLAGRKQEEFGHLRPCFLDKILIITMICAKNSLRRRTGR